MTPLMYAVKDNRTGLLDRMIEFFFFFFFFSFVVIAIVIVILAYVKRKKFRRKIIAIVLLIIKLASRCVAATRNVARAACIRRARACTLR